MFVVAECPLLALHASALRKEIGGGSVVVAALDTECYVTVDPSKPGWRMLDASYSCGLLMRKCVLESSTRKLIALGGWFFFFGGGVSSNSMRTEVSFVLRTMIVSA